MTTKIFILSWFSYIESDNYLYSDIKTFTDEEKAMAEFESDCEKAYDECKWGCQWDESEDERDEDCAYDVDESRDPGTYQVSSGAYDGYHVEVSIEEKEIEIPATDKNSKGEAIVTMIGNKSVEPEKKEQETIMVLYFVDEDNTKDMLLAARKSDLEAGNKRQEIEQCLRETFNIDERKEWEDCDPEGMERGLQKAADKLAKGEQAYFDTYDFAWEKVSII